MRCCCGLRKGCTPGIAHAKSKHLSKLTRKEPFGLQRAVDESWVVGSGRTGMSRDGVLGMNCGLAREVSVRDSRDGARTRHHMAGETTGSADASIYAHPALGAPRAGVRRRQNLAALLCRRRHPSCKKSAQKIGWQKGRCSTNVMRVPRPAAVRTGTRDFGTIAAQATSPMSRNSIRDASTAAFHGSQGVDRSRSRHLFPANTSLLVTHGYGIRSSISQCPESHVGKLPPLLRATPKNKATQSARTMRGQRLRPKDGSCCG